MQENIALARQFLLELFVSRGIVVDFAVYQPDRKDGRYSASMCYCPSNPSCRTAAGATNNAGNICWMSTASASGTRLEIMCSTPFPPPTGAVPTPWSSGGRRERNCAAPNSWKRDWIATSTTAAMRAKVWSSFPPSMKPPTVKAMDKKASAPTKATSTVGSRKPMPCYGRQSRKSSPCTAS